MAHQGAAPTGSAGEPSSRADSGAAEPGSGGDGGAADPTAPPSGAVLLPDHAAADRAATAALGAAAVPAASAPASRGLPAGAVVAIVVTLVCGLVAAVTVAVAGLATWQVLADRGDDGGSGAGVQEVDPGEVTDSTGAAVEDGTGSYGDPATVGEHTFSWPVWTGGSVDVTATAVDTDAQLPGAAGADVVQDGYQLVIAEVEVRYRGAGQLVPLEELWVGAETDQAYLRDTAPGLLPDPLRSVGPLADGDRATFRAAYLVESTQMGSLRLSFETYDGEVLYYAVA